VTAAGPWPDPFDRDDDNTPPAYDIPPPRPEPDGMPVRDPAMFYGLLGDIVTTADPTTEGDKVGVLVSLLAGVGVAIGAGPHIMVGNSPHPLLVSPLLFGSTGSGRKGEATSTAKLFLEAADQSFTEFTVTGLSSGEGLIERIKDPVDNGDDGDKRRRRNDWPGTTDKRLLVIEPEFTTTMARARREGSTLAGVIRQCFDGGKLSVLNKAMVTASSSHVAIIGHVTPREFRIRMAESELAGGTYNRFLPVYVERSKRLPLPEGVSTGDVTRLADQLRRAIAGARRVPVLRLGDDARHVWSDGLYDELSGADDDDHAWTEFTRRAAPYCLRIGALYAVLDGRRHVTADDLHAAAALVRYAIDSARYVLGATSRDPRIDRIRRALDEADIDGLTRTDVSKLFSRHLTAGVLDELLAQVLTDDHYRVEETATGGRPVRRYYRC
jgi:Protein of unknown function (DUF3987)